MARPTIAGLPRDLALRGIGAALLLGLIYTLSPLSVWFAAGVALLLARVGRDLPEREREWVIRLLAVALLVRVIVVAGLFLSADYDSQAFATFFGDETYMQRRALRLRNIGLGMPASHFELLDAYDEYGWTSYLYVLTYLQLLVGPAPYGARLMNALLFVGGALLLYRVVRPAYGRLPAFGGLAVLLFLPSLLAWSISLLKESLYFFLTAATMALVVGSVRADGWRPRLAAAAGAAGVAVIANTVRPSGLVILAAAVAGGLAVWLLTARPRRAVVAMILLSIVAVPLFRHPAVQARVIERVQAAAKLHRGHFLTVGHGYKLLEERYYELTVTRIDSMTGREMGRFVARALLSVIIVPLPWQIATRAELAYLPEQVAWLGLVVLGPIGLVAGFRRDRLVTCMLAANIGAAGFVIALTSGNVGTLIRHRALIMPYLAWLSVLGLVALVSRLSAGTVVAAAPAVPASGNR